ncbi:hypothetical protein [Paraflavitalea speifideaquila]|uniref:hypothetical protein n=1 Tax=Paraflavitalea speifideaquila TaxID=3076558 RepID=UPI0028E99ACD|nr:hypothetical protein [Paraflavitalea speifideiaquila]
MKPHMIPLPKLKMGNSEEGGEEEKGKLSIAKCRELLKEEGRNLTDEQILKIRDFMYRLAAIGWEQYQYQQQQAKVIHLEEHKTVNNENSHCLRTGWYR